MKKNDFPPESENSLVKNRIKGIYITSSEWYKMASLAVDEQRFGDAYYYWYFASCVCQGKGDKKAKYIQCSKNCLKAWRDKNL